MKHDFYDVTVILSVTEKPDIRVKIFYRQCTREKVLENDVLSPILEELDEITEGD